MSSCSSEINSPSLSTAVVADCVLAKISSSGTNRLSDSAGRESPDAESELVSVKNTSSALSLPVTVSAAAVAVPPAIVASDKSNSTPPPSAVPLPMVRSLLREVTVVSGEVALDESANVCGFNSTVYSLTSLTLPGESTSIRKFKNGSSTGLSLVTLTIAFPSGRRSTTKSTEDKTGGCSRPARAKAAEDASPTCKSCSSDSVADRISISASRVSFNAEYISISPSPSAWETPVTPERLRLTATAIAIFRTVLRSLFINKSRSNGSMEKKAPSRHLPVLSRNARPVPRPSVHISSFNGFLLG